MCNRIENTPQSLEFSSDEALCTMAISGNREAEEILVTRYNRLVRTCARPFFLIGGDSEDLTQEGMVGLIKAVREYDASKEASFRTFAEICIRNRLYSVLRAAARDKHCLLYTSAVSFGRGRRTAPVVYGRAFWMRPCACTAVLLAGVCVDLCLSPVFLRLVLAHMAV